MDALKSIKDWPFLQEPMWRWFIFLGAMIFISLVWRIILSYMKAG